MSIGQGFVPITPSDTINNPQRAEEYPDAVRFGTGGTASYVAVDGTVATLTNIADGEIIAIACKRINATGSIGIADIVGIYT